MKNVCLRFIGVFRFLFLVKPAIKRHENSCHPISFFADTSFTLYGIYLPFFNNILGELLREALLKFFEKRRKIDKILDDEVIAMMPILAGLEERCL